jgi:hypothetical protein
VKTATACREANYDSNTINIMNVNSSIIVKFSRKVGNSTEAINMKAKTPATSGTVTAAVGTHK